MTQLERLTTVQKLWNAEAPKLRPVQYWSSLDVGFQKYLLEKVENCSTKEEIKTILWGK